MGGMESEPRFMVVTFGVFCVDLVENQGAFRVVMGLGG